MNRPELIEARPDLTQRAIESSTRPNGQITVGEFILRIFVVAVGIVFGAIFALIVGLFTGLIQFTC